MLWGLSGNPPLKEVDSTFRTDRGHEFQVRFHWHVEDQGIRHVYIKPQTPQLNGKVVRSHRTDQTEFCQLLTYTDDIALGAHA